DQHDAFRISRMPQRIRHNNRCAEGMTNEDRMMQVEARLEGAHEGDPATERVRPPALRVPERRQVERIHAVVPAEPSADTVPDGAWNDKTAEQNDRRPARAPASVGH